MPETADNPSTVSQTPVSRPGGLWRHRDFMLLWSGQTISEMGSAVTQLALPLVAVVALKATTFEVGLLTAASTLAFALIALPAGAIVDRHAKHRVMIGCDVARLVIIGSVPVAWAAGVLTMGQLYAVALVAGVFTVFFDVSYQSYLPSLLAHEHLVDANGKFGASQSFAQLVGPGLGGGLVGAFGAAGSMTADAISYAVSVASLLGIRTREEPPPRTGLEQRSLRSEIAEGLRFVTGHPILRKVVACTGTANLFSSISTAVEIIFLIRVLHVRPAYVGLIFALAAIGGILGGVLAGRLARWIGSARVIWFSILVLSVPQILPALAEPGWRIVLYPIGFAFMFFSAVVYNVAQLSYRQMVTPAPLMGRMNAAVRWIVWGTMPLGAVIGGALGTAIGIRPTLWIGFIGSWAAGFLVYFSPLRRLRDLPPSSPDLLYLRAVDVHLYRYRVDTGHARMAPAGRRAYVSREASPGRRHPMPFRYQARRVFLAPTLAVALGVALAACSSSASSSSSSVAASTAASTAAASASASSANTASTPATTGGGSTAAVAAIKANWVKFFSSSTPNSERVALLENGQTFASAIKSFSSSPLASAVTSKVDTVTLNSATKATVKYDLTAAGQSVASGQTGTAILQNGTWKVGDDVFCGLLKQGATILGMTVPAACK